MSEVKNRRVTMTKPIVGKVKASAYALPDHDFVYGIESKHDNEGAGAGKSFRFYECNSLFDFIDALTHLLSIQWYKAGHNLNQANRHAPCNHFLHPIVKLSKMDV